MPYNGSGGVWNLRVGEAAFGDSFPGSLFLLLNTPSFSVIIYSSEVREMYQPKGFFGMI